MVKRDKKEEHKTTSKLNINQLTNADKKTRKSEIMPPQIEKQQKQPQPKSVSFHGGDVITDVDTSTSGAAADKTPPPSSSSSSSSTIHLRWSRIKKEVVIKESNSGLLRGSIAAPTPESKAGIAATAAAATAAAAQHQQQQKQQLKKKVILSEVSGEASPGQVLAMMG